MSVPRKERNHRGHRRRHNSLCPQEEFPLKDITEKIIASVIEVHSTLWPGLLESIYEAQVLTYLKAMGKREGLLINFNVLRLKEGIKRLIM